MARSKFRRIGQLIDKTIAFEQRYAYYACPEGLLGLNANPCAVAD